MILDAYLEYLKTRIIEKTKIKNTSVNIQYLAHELSCALSA